MAQRRNRGGKGNCRTYKAVEIFPEIWSWLIFKQC